MKSMLELLVVRHGQSVADIENRFEGRADFELTPYGIWNNGQLAGLPREEGVRRFPVPSGSHGGYINMLFRSFLRLQVNTDTSIKNGDTDIHLWGIHGDERRIVFTNYQEHIRDLL